MDPKHFTLCKGKLRTAAPRMVPVVITPAAEPPVSEVREVASGSTMVCLRLSLEIAPGALPALMRELRGGTSG